MNVWKTSAGFAVAMMMTAGFLATASAQHGIQSGNSLIPESSIEHPGDIGVRPHTNIRILNIGSKASVGFHPMGGLGPGGGFTPTQIRSFYNLPAAGGSQIIAIIDAYDDPNALGDFNKFSAQFGLAQETSSSVTSSTNKVFQVIYAGGVQPATDSTGGWELEESLDIEWAHAMAPNAKIVLVEAASNSYVNLFAAVQTATGYTDGNGKTVNEIAMSWSGSEFSSETMFDPDLDVSGPTFFGSSGDSGAGANYPSVSPYVVSLGGTTVTTNNSGNFVSEAGWANSGGGPSAYETRPAYQNGISSIVGGNRGTPDIAFDAYYNTGV